VIGGEIVRHPSQHRILAPIRRGPGMVMRLIPAHAELVAGDAGQGKAVPSALGLGRRLVGVGIVLPLAPFGIKALFAVRDFRVGQLRLAEDILWQDRAGIAKGVLDVIGRS